MLKLTRWTTAHRHLVVLAWIVLAAGVLGASQAVGNRTANNLSLSNTDSQRAVDLLRSRFPAQAGDADQIAFRARTGTLTDASTRAVVTPLLVRIARLPHVTGVVSPYATGANAIAKSGKIGFATVEFDQRASQLPKAAIDRVITTATSARSSALQVELGGQAIQQAQQTGLGFATGVGLAAAMIVLLISFGSLLAMGLPSVTAVVGLGAGRGLRLVVAASLTLLPALLMFTGRRVGRIRARRSSAREPRAGFWFHWVGLIQRRPAWAALASTVLLLTLAAPALGLRLGASDSGNDPPKETTRQAYDLLATGFGSGFNGPLQLAVRLPGTGDTTGLARI